MTWVVVLLWVLAMLAWPLFYWRGMERARKTAAELGSLFPRLEIPYAPESHEVCGGFWGKWGEEEEIMIRHKWTMAQTRECTGCGLRETRAVKVYQWDE